MHQIACTFSNQQLYLLNQIKTQVLAKQQLLHVFDAIIISCITYAAAAWKRFATVAECNAIQAFLNKVKGWGIISMTRSIDDNLDGIYYGLFKKNAVFQPLFTSYFAK